MSWQVLNLRKLDDGGFATVYLGTRSDNGEQVVVKYLRDITPDNRRYFLREAKILGRRIHGRMVEFLGGQPDGPQPYYIMPYYPGGKLTRWAGKLNHAQLRAVAHQIAEALAHLHAAEVFHGDVKPDNILLTKAGDLRLGDPLGNGAGCTIVYAVNSGGTPGYWAPEVAARVAPISRAGDVFSFGATLFHLVTGRLPTDGQNLDPRAAGFIIPDDIRNIILACCKTDARNRPTMQQVLAFVPASMPPAAPGKPAPAKTTGNGGAAALGVLALFLGVAAMVGANGKRPG